LLLLASAFAVASAAPAGAARGFELGFVEELRHLNGPLAAAGGSGSGSSATSDEMVADIVVAGGKYVRIPVSWRNIAPTEPTGDPTHPGSYGAMFVGLDRAVRRLRTAGLEPILSVYVAPEWAMAPSSSDERPEWGRRPIPLKYAQFMRAVAQRYNGTFEPSGGAELPRVRYYQVWNEVNLPRFYLPQYRRGRLVSPHNYRRLVNLTAPRVLAVNPGARILAGGLAPLGRPTNNGPGPLLFTREALERRIAFHAWTTHPYTTGGPTHSAFRPNDVALGDLPQMRAVLNKYARRFGTPRKQFWVTEFSWDSKAPDPKGVPMRIHSRWVAEAIYQMWRSGVSVLTWFKVHDAPCAWPDDQSNGRRCDDRDAATPYDFWQSGLYACGHPSRCLTYVPKPSLTAFRFPFVAYKQRGRPRITLWGRTPEGDRGTVRIERYRNGGWRFVRNVRAGSTGIFQATLRKSWRAGKLHAEFGDEASLAFSLTRPRSSWPPRGVGPFGS
jgi:hypothetical protein